jgi:SAM-dependent methyltransferase
LTAILKRQLANVEYIAADLDPEPYRNVMDIVRADITNLQWDKGHFDLVICNHVLEHVPDDRKAMSELFRVMRPEGTAILQVPIAGAPRETVEDPSIECADERERLFGQVDHVRIYGTDYVDRLRGAGFNVDLFNPNSWGAQVIDELRLDPRERVIIARKSK